MSGNNLRKLFGTDNKAETEGIWIDYADGIAMKIARTGGANTAYSRYLANLLKPYKFQLDRGTLSEETSRELLVDAFANCVLKDWKGITDDKGKVLEYSAANAKKILIEYPELFSELQTLAGDYRRFAQGALEETAKN